MKSLNLLACTFCAGFVLSCNSANHFAAQPPQLAGNWQLVDAENNIGLQNIGVILLLQAEGPVQFGFDQDSHLRIRNKSNSVLEEYAYTLGQNDAITLSGKSGRQQGRLEFKTPDSLLLRFPGYSYTLTKN